MIPPISIKDRLMTWAKKKGRNYPCHTNRASELGHPCLRYLYYCRMNWQDKSPPSPGLQLIFDAGNALEAFTLRQLEDAGLEIFEQQTPLDWKEYGITGHVDAMVKGVDGANTYPLEVKHLNQFTFAKIQGIADFLEAAQVWMRKYPTQIALYMMMKSSEWGCLLIRNKQDFSIKEIWFTLDDILGIAEEALQKAERVNLAVAEESPPERMPFEETCLECNFFHICIPDQIRGAKIEISDHRELHAGLVKLEALEKELKIYESETSPIEKEIKKIKAYIDTQVKDKETLLIGDYAVTGKLGKRKGYTVEDSEKWKWKWKRIGEEK